MDTTNQTQSELQFTVNGVSFKMIKVEGGTFTMGAHANQEDEADFDEKPAHSVTLSSYYIAETEVTQALWQAVMGNNPSSFQDNINNPVECVSYDRCQKFISKINALTNKQFRLPTEAEWEFAARGGNKSKDYIYAGSNNLDDVAWYADNSDRHTHPVKTKAPNELGLYDMSGNVQEWCNDYLDNYPSTAQTNPQGPISGSYRVNRGCCWAFAAEYCRSSYRSGAAPFGHCYFDGFRLALDE
jgi:formylglycine-generating enzyme required for sulfatase activity